MSFAFRVSLFKSIGVTLSNLVQIVFPDTFAIIGDRMHLYL